jgi:hypothetical protein
MFSVLLVLTAIEQGFLCVVAWMLYNATLVIFGDSSKSVLSSEVPDEDSETDSSRWRNNSGGTTRIETRSAEGYRGQPVMNRGVIRRPDLLLIFGVL